jgi:sialate O-acetylesterase
VADHTEVANILVGDIWILAGQSNMEGVGNLEGVEEPSPFVHCYTMAHRWELATEPLHWLIDSPDPVHSGRYLKDLDEEGRRARRSAARASRTKGAGLGLPFAKAVVERTGVPIGLIASAHGGTSMQQWDPSGRDLGAASLYGSMLKQVRHAGGRARGVLWYQGESDANEAAVPLFAERFETLVAAFRKDLADPELPFYYVQIGRFVREGPSEFWDQIQELQRLAERKIPGTAVVSVIDLPLDDLIHVGTSGLKRVGWRLAAIALKEVYGFDDLERGPRLADIELSEDRTTVRVRYSSVNGGLLPEEKVEGFSLRRKDGSEVKLIYNVSVDPEAPDTVVLKLQSPVPEDALLWYGVGLDPVCNLVDEEGMAALVFGPATLR